MVAAVYPIYIEKGATYRKPFVRRNKLTQLPIDLTGYTGRMHIRATQLAADPPIIALTTENGGIIVDGPAGKVTIYISDTATAALPAGDATYDLELVTPSGDVIRMLKGKVKIDQDVTR